MKKITVRQLLDAEKSGRELTEAETAALRQFRFAIAESMKIKSAVTDAIKEALNKVPKQGPFDFLLNGGFFNHICNKYPDYTLSELQFFLKGGALEAEYIEYSKMVVSRMAIDLTKNKPAAIGPTQKQKAIILYFLDKADKDNVPRSSKKDFLKKYNNSASLYHEWLNVSQGQNIDEKNLKVAIEFISDPEAKKLAITHLRKIEK
jgi:hypothetical protein